MAQRLLVVEDDRDAALAVTELLASEGYHVTTFHDGQHALDHYRAHPIDLIVSDIRMPAMDGLTLTTRVREAGDVTPVILMSGHDPPEHAGRMSNVTFLKKPIDADLLIEAIALVLSGPALFE